METKMKTDSLPVWEVFIQAKSGAPFQHTGNVHAADKELAMQMLEIYIHAGWKVLAFG